MLTQLSEQNQTFAEHNLLGARQLRRDCHSPDPHRDTEAWFVCRCTLT